MTRDEFKNSSQLVTARRMFKGSYPSFITPTFTCAACRQLYEDVDWFSNVIKCNGRVCR